MHRRNWWKNIQERDHLKDLGLDVVIKMYLQEMKLGSMDWIDPAQDMDK